jgi:phosphate acetyltransferase
MDTAVTSATIENVPCNELAVGARAELVRTLGPEDIQLFAAASGDFNPAHLDVDYAKDTPFNGVIAHGMWGGALISAVLGTRLPGPGTIYLDQSLHFSRPVRPGDTVTASVTCVEKHDETRRARFDCRVVNQRGETVIRGVAEVLVPATKIRLPRPDLPSFTREALPA